MVYITVWVAEVTSITIASQLPTNYSITIVGKHFPGDAGDFEYASNWAGACRIEMPISSPKIRNSNSTHALGF
ncbi:ATP-dependent DNA helicase Q-like 3 [Fusarium oxysporum f. sp. albedinis]|nr:ATP-dependent DNA helicase Q-like 3 [Fusarium oxysporum f. sp. albedinis]